MTAEEGRYANSTRAPRTSCKVCWCSVFADDDTVWVIHPAPGLAHRVCVEETPKRNR